MRQDQVDGFPKEFVKVVAAKPSEKNGSKAEATSTDGVPEHVLAVFRDLDKDGGALVCHGASRRDA